jgi:ribosome-associated protein
MKPEALSRLAVEALEDRKAAKVRVLDVRGLCSFTDFMIIASGSSNRQVKAMADNVIEKAKADGVPPLGVEGHQAGEWVLIDLGDVVVHAMQPATREFYQLEKLWDVDIREASDSG